MNDRIGFMQGRLSPLVGDGRIQGFPWSSWQAELQSAERLGLRLMEWTLDQERLHENPLLTSAGQAEIRVLCDRHHVAIPSLTGDCFMQAPFWKANTRERSGLQRDFLAVAEASAAIGIATLVVPLVDNGRLDDAGQEEVLVTFLSDQAGFLSELGLRVAFESDYAPADLARFIGRLAPRVFGVNYDIGNSAALGFHPADEFNLYGHRVVNVHVKDRLRGGITVPLGSGNADFEAAFLALAQVRYNGNYILQSARAVDDDHAGVLCRYRDLTADWLSRHAA